MTTKELALRHDEPNLARLNLVLAPNRTELFEWSREITLDAIGGIRIACTAPRNGLVPHGIDNDILLGLVNAVVLQGMPEDDTVRLSTRELLQLSGITPSARAYKNLFDSLRRLQHTAYELTDSWYDGSKHRWRTVSFSLITKMGAEDNTTDVTNVGRWRAETVLAIRLDDSLISNIRAGHILPLDVEMLSKLSQPLTRNLFRTLSFQRGRGVDQEPVLAFTIPLSTWATHLGMHEMRLDTVMRALKPAHQELIEVGFLREVEYMGRGKSRTVSYAFASAKTPTADPEAVAMLVRYGVSGGRALTLAQTYGSAAVQRAVSVLEALLHSGYRTKIRNRAGILNDILQSPDKYDTLLSNAEASAPPADSAEKPVTAALDDDAEGRTAAPRTVKSAHMILLGRYDDTEERRALRDRAADLYVAGRVTTLDLIGLLALETPEAATLIRSWENG